MPVVQMHLARCMLYEYTYSLHQEIMMDIPRLEPITA